MVTNIASKGLKTWAVALIVLATTVTSSLYGMQGADAPITKGFDAMLQAQDFGKLIPDLRYAVEKLHKPEVMDWLEEGAYTKCHVPLMYERFRKFKDGIETTAPNTKNLRYALAWMVISLVLTKADVDCCTKMAHLKNPAYEPYNWLSCNYAYRLDRQELFLPYKEIIGKAKQIFDKELFVEVDAETVRLREDLPYPVWVCGVTNNARIARRWVDFNTPDTQVRGTYAAGEVVLAVERMRVASFEKTWAMFERCEDWIQFFALTTDAINNGEIKEAPAVTANTPEPMEEGGDGEDAGTGDAQGDPVGQLTEAVDGLLVSDKKDGQ